MIPVLAYHKVDVGLELGVNTISPQCFERQMRFLAEQGYTAITPDDLVHAVQSHWRPSLPYRAILITFDDGYESFYTYAYPILKKYGMRATVFIIAGYMGRLNTWDVQLGLRRSKHLSQDHILALFKDGMGIGSHGLHHRFLTHCGSVEVMAELRESKALLENLLQHPIHSFAYPYGSADRATAEIVRSTGYRIAFSLHPNRAGTFESIYRFPRVAIYRCDTFRSFRAKLGLLGKSRFAIECAKNRLINRLAYLNLLWKWDDGTGGGRG